MFNFVWPDNLLKIFYIATDRGIIIRTLTTVVGVLMMIVGVALIFKEPVMKAAGTAAKAAAV